MLSIKAIKDNLEGKDYIIINIIKNLNYEFNQFGEEFILNKNNQMDDVDINILFGEIDKNIEKYKHKLCFVIFNEHFFSYHSIISKEKFNLIMDLSTKLTNKFGNLIMIINLLHFIDDNLISEDYYQKCLIYFQKIYDEDSKEIWDISSDKFINIFNINNGNFYSNESLVIMRGKILYTYKKATYYMELEKNYEVNTNDFNNYIIGFGLDEISKDLKEDDLPTISKILSKYISIEICYDLQKNIKNKSFENFMVNNEIQRQIDELKKIRKNVENYSNKKLIIIQSNTTNIYEQISLFPENVIIAKCDPIQQLVFIKNEKELVEEINSIEEYNKLQIEHENNKTTQILDRKKIRLNHFCTKNNEKCEILNVHKYIKEFKPEILLKKNIGTHQIIFYLYNLSLKKND